VKRGGERRKSSCLGVLRNKTAPEHEATAKYWKGERKGKEKRRRIKYNGQKEKKDR
jgi:hypothetical protein